MTMDTWNYWLWPNYLYLGAVLWKESKWLASRIPHDPRSLVTGSLASNSSLRPDDGPCNGELQRLIKYLVHYISNIIFTFKYFQNCQLKKKEFKPWKTMLAYKSFSSEPHVARHHVRGNRVVAGGFVLGGEGAEARRLLLLGWLWLTPTVLLATTKMVCEEKVTSPM